MEKQTRKPATVPRKAISTNTFAAWFNVETVHKQRLEFVLVEAGARQGELRPTQVHPQGRVFTTYADSLFAMLCDEFKSARAGMSVTEMQEYGDLSFHVEADTPQALQRALVRCEKVAQRWINKYRVNAMKEA